MANLYIVATPIGNLQDITLRAIDILKKVDFILCEDTRKTGFLLEKIIGQKIPKEKLASYYEQNEIKRNPGVIQLLDAGYDVALVSDAGTPLISDPGFKLVRECAQKGIKVVSIPGPSSVTSSLVVSGLPTDKFLYLGFLPKKQGNRKTILNNVLKMNKLIESTIIIFEAPHRLVTLLKEMIKTFGDIEIVVVRELTKIFEDVKRNNISELISYYEKSKPKGEIVILFSLKDKI